MRIWHRYYLKALDAHLDYLMIDGVWWFLVEQVAQAMGITDLPTQLADLENRTVMAGLIKTISSESTPDDHRHSVTLIAHRGVSAGRCLLIRTN